MADYYSVLKKTINGLQENTGSARRGVYQRARSAIVKQLQNYDPPLTPSQITEEQLKLEEAIRKVEAEAARASLGLGAASSPQAVQPTSAPKPSAAPHSYGAAKTGGPTETQPVGAPSGSQPTPSAGAGEGPQKPPADTASHAAEKHDEGQDVFKQAVKAASDLGSAAHQANQKAREHFPEAPREKREPEFDSEASQAPSKAESPEAKASPASSKRPAREEDLWVPGEARKQARGDDDTSPKPETPKSVSRERPRGQSKRTAAKAASASASINDEGLKPSRMPQLIGLLIVLALLGAGGYALYSQKDDLMALIEPVQEETDSEAPPAEPAQPAEPQIKKNTDRLLNDDGSQVSPDARAVTTERVTSVSRDVTDDAASTDAPTPAAPQPQEIPAAEELDSVSVRTDTVRPAERITEQDTQTAVAQQGILYEEAATPGESGTASRGNVIWTLEPAGSGKQMVKAVAVMPERNVTVTMSLKPNTDDSLPASHLLELQFDLPGDFSGQGISEVPGIIMKPTEQARGEPLAGAAVKVSDNFFWIALSDAEAERVTNMKRLQEREWIDIPLLYNNGKRAILTFEKGVAGNRVISKAMESWN